MALAYSDAAIDIAPGHNEADIVLDMVSEIMWRLNHDTACDDVAITRLAAAIGADAAVSLDGSHPGTPTVCAVWPSPDAASDLVGVLQDPEFGNFPPHFTQLHHPRLGQVVVVSITPEGVGAPHSFARVMAFARREPGFGGRDLSLLQRACVPLAGLWPFAARCHQLRQADHAVHRLAELHQMTSREIQVLALLAEGLLATSIASRLDLSPRTVHKHLGNIYRKLGVHDRLVAVKLGRHYGLIPLTVDGDAAL